MLARHLRLRVLQALEERVKQFRTREPIYPLRIPREPILLDDIILQAIPDDGAGFDETALRSRILLTLRWDEVAWSAWVITLSSGVKVYCDSDVDETRVLASGGKNAGDESDRLFLSLLAESAGAHFGIEMAGGAPTAVRSSIDRTFLVEFFVNLFEGSEAEASVRAEVSVRAAHGGRGLPAPREQELLSRGGRDFKLEVEQWLTGVMPRV